MLGFAPLAVLPLGAVVQVVADPQVDIRVGASRPREDKRRLARKARSLAAQEELDRIKREAEAAEQQRIALERLAAEKQVDLKPLVAQAQEASELLRDALGAPQSQPIKAKAPTQAAADKAIAERAARISAGDQFVAIGSEQEPTVEQIPEQTTQPANRLQKKAHWSQNRAARVAVLVSLLTMEY